MGLSSERWRYMVVSFPLAEPIPKIIPEDKYKHLSTTRKDFNYIPQLSVKE